VRSVRFLLSRRWVAFFLVVVVLAYATWWLGRWQFHRLEDRKHDNAVVERNEGAAPVTVAEVLAPGRDVDPDDEWRAVTATGTYLPDETVIVRYRTHDGSSGIDVVVPLQTADGPALLVDRGWLATGNGGATPDDVPAPPSGEVTVTGYVRQDATGDSAKVTDGSTRSISSERIGPAIGREVYGGFVDLATEDPEPATALVKAELPDLGNGPHFFYGLQWWFFGLLAVFGFLYLAYDEWTGGARNRRQNVRSIPPSTGSITPVTNDAAGESKKAAARPNSSGSP
jgi:cytochrome oxidase assembly protein ShyY1